MKTSELARKVYGLWGPPNVQRPTPAGFAGFPTGYGWLLAPGMLTSHSDAGH